MRTLIAGLAIAISVLAINRVAAADEPPAFDIARNCKAEATDSGMGKNCTNDETDAKNELAKRWSSFSASQKKSCVVESSIGEQSYVELLTCLEMFSGQFDDRKK